MILTKDILGGRSRRLDETYREGYGYKLDEGSQFGLDVAFGNVLDIDESRMSIVIPYADGNRRDGVGDLLEVGGINVQRHRINPVVLFDHGKEVKIPIGISEDPDTGEYTNYIDPVARTASVKAFFFQGDGGKKFPALKKEGSDGVTAYDHALFCNQLFDLMAKKFIRAGSIGYQVIHAKQLQPDYENGTPQGLHLLSVLMLEASAVVMPANADTVRKALCLSNVCGKPMSPMLVKSLSPYVGEKKAVVTSGYQKGSQIPVPLQTVRTPGNIPPSKWKPGAGAIKDLRMRYRKGKKELPNEDEKARDASVANTTNFQVGQTVVARTHISRTNPTTGKVDTFAKPGDRLKVEKVLSIGSAEVSRLGWPGVVLVGIPEIRKTKDLESEAKSFDLKELRYKYRKAKGLRRRLRKSTAGSSLIHVRKKDIDKLKEEAEAKGVKFDWRGTHSNGNERVKLTGDDEAIDSMARKFGRRMKSLNSGAKAMDDEMIDATTDEVGIEDKDMPDEPLSAQFLRRVHEDKSILMQDYHDIIRHVEHPEIRKFAEETLLPALEDIMSGVEELFETHHPDLPGIEGAMVKDDDDIENTDEKGEDLEFDDTVDETADIQSEGDSTDDREEEEPTGDEVVEGMETKRLKKIKTKSAECTCKDKKNCKCGNKAIKTKSGEYYSGKVRGEQVATFSYKTGASGKATAIMMYDKTGKLIATERKSERELIDLGRQLRSMGAKETQAKALTDDEVDVIKDDIDTQAADTEDAPVESLSSKALEMEEKAELGEVSNYLKDVSTLPDLEDDHRLKAYHYHKNLEQMSGMDAFDMKALDDEETEDKSIPGDLEWLQEEGAEGEHKNIHPHRKMCGKSSRFLKGLSTERAFGETHRDTAMALHKEMEGAINEDQMEDEVKDDEMMEEVVEEEIPEPGTMDTKSGEYYSGKVRGEQVATFSYKTGASGKATAIMMYDKTGKLIATERKSEKELIDLGRQLRSMGAKETQAKALTDDEEKSVKTKSDDDLEDKDEKKLKGTLLAQRKMMRELYSKLNGLAKIR